MTLSRLNPSKQAQLAEPGERLRPVPESGLPPVSALHGAAPDRQRSVQQEINEFEANAIGAFHGQAQILRDAQALAAELSAPGSSLRQSIKPAATLAQLLVIDEEV